MAGRKGEWVTTEDWRCAVCEGHGMFQWVEGLGEPEACPACKGVGFRKSARWVDAQEEVKDGG